MAIPLTCPSCHQEFKVKDELAGRRIKCPKCAAVMAVTEQRVSQEALASKKARRTRDLEEHEEPEEEQRPKKKKKKKGAGNRGLIIGSVIGGVALLIVIILVIVFSGGEKPKAAVAEKKNRPQAIQQNQPDVAKGPRNEKKGPAGGIARSRERTEIESTLRQLGVAYRNFEVQNNRGPKDQKELAPYYENNNRINEFLTKEWITFIWGVNRSGFPDGTSNTILAYEDEADIHHNRFVLMGDVSVQTLDEETFKKTPKAKGK